ncbi:DUF3127 domain-containing protein [Palleniella muris]|uniref:DUF3127 domain-containing protein n=1 Tax=Palleniella muris TaxID=3038145 RepID=A0AC61QLU5_9BACT|nr:DUF3127 domain-containing protein [Palleniella muris]TGX79990.1 DUF3127 domain-containing protein [Palleniella muris]
MELQGKVIYAAEKRTGESARGTWAAQDFVIETHDSFPRKMVFSVFGEDRLQRFNIQVGQEVNVSFDIDAREYNGRWFNSIRAFDVRQIVANAAPVAGDMPPFAEPAAAPAADPFSQAASSDSTDDLPF